MRTTLAGLLALMLLLTACSGTEEEAGDDVSTDTSDEAEEDAPDDGEVEDSGESADAEDAGGEPGGGESWTFLVYSMADTNLEAPMLEDLEEMAAIGSGDGLSIVSLVDRHEAETDTAILNLDDWTTAKLLEVNTDDLVEIEDLGEVDMADPAQLAEFIAFGIENYPADNYALTINDHGGGWLGIGPDDSSGGSLDLQELDQAIGEGLAAGGVERLGLLGFDACLMATYEVASTLAPHADYLLASEETEPGHGWDYRSLAAVRDDPSMSAQALGEILIEGYQGHAEEFGQEAEITLSLIDLGAMPALDEAMTAFAGVLAEQASALGPVIGRELEEGIAYGRSPDPSQSTQLTDLGVFVSEVGIESLQVADPADAVLRAINDTVVAQTVGPARLGSTGMSIYFPPVPELLDADYANSAVVGPWLQFLNAYHGAGDAIAVEDRPQLADPAVEQPEPAAEGETVYVDAFVEDVEGGILVSVELDPATVGNVVDARLSFGYVDPEDGAIVQLGDTAAEVGEDGVVSGFSDLTVLTLTDADEDQVDAYLSYDFDEDAGVAVASVPLDYTDATTGELSAVDLSLVFDEEFNVIQETYYLIDEETGGYGELQADPASLISPVVLVFAPDTEGEWQTYGDQQLFADLPALQYGFELLEPGTEIYVDLVVTDFGGNDLIASAQFVQE